MYKSMLLCYVALAFAGGAYMFSAKSTFGKTVGFFQMLVGFTGVVIMLIKILQG